MKRIDDDFWYDAAIAELRAGAARLRAVIASVETPDNCTSPYFAECLPLPDYGWEK